jgi:alkylation response protein AidB-like acyl-CoA dehydrogenase
MAPDSGQSLKLLEPKSAEAILANCETIGPIIDAEAPEIERIGCLTASMKQVLVDAGCFRMCFPKRLGGPEIGFRDQVRVMEILARRDGSVAWNVKILSDSGYYAARLSADACRVLYPSIDSATAGALFPIGRADVVGDEFEVSGLWHFGSGVKSADQVVGGVHVYENGEIWRHANGSPVAVYVYLPLSKIDIQDNWHVTGMRGSGSNSYGVNKARVPRINSFVRSAPPDANADPLVRHAELPFFNTIGTTLGLAAHALDVAKARITSGREPLAKQQSAQKTYGEAWSYLDAARAHANCVAEDLDRVLFSGNRLLDKELFARMLAAPATVQRFCRHVVDLAVELNGAASIYETNPMERVVRDLQANAVHIANTPRKWADASAHMLVGAPS